MGVLAESVCFVLFKITLEDISVGMVENPLARGLSISPFANILGVVRPLLGAISMLKLCVLVHSARVGGAIWHLYGHRI